MKEIDRNKHRFTQATSPNYLSAVSRSPRVHSVRHGDDID